MGRTDLLGVAAHDLQASAMCVKPLDTCHATRGRLPLEPVVSSALCTVGNRRQLTTLLPGSVISNVRRSEDPKGVEKCTSSTPAVTGCQVQCRKC